MTVEMMHASSKLELSKLSRTAKQELLAWVRNQVCIITGSEQLTAEDDRLPAMVRARARLIDRTAKRFMEEFEQLLMSDVNAHIGSGEHQ